MKLNRRKFNIAAGASALTLGMGVAPQVFGASHGTPKVVVIGGGSGGATAARYIAKDSKGAIEVTLIEPTKRYYTCYFSNLYIGGFVDYDSLGHSYAALASEYGINVVHDWAVTVDRKKKVVILGSGSMVPYDKLVVSPGIDLKFASVAEGYSIADQGKMPHAWKSGTQAQLLKAKVTGMKEGGTFVMVPPPNPFRCPPGPYERISMIAHHFKNNNPKAKIIILDPKDKFSKQGLFQDGWERHYKGMIEWQPLSALGGLKSINTATGEFVTDLDTFKADAACVIPANTSGQIAKTAGLANDKGWCPIHQGSMKSKVDDDIYVIGDASVASSMPKSGFSANSQAKVCANAIRGELTKSKVFPAKYANTCWSLIAPNDGVKVGASYKAGDKKIDPTSKFISKNGEDADTRKTTYEESVGWYSGITKDIFG